MSKGSGGPKAGHCANMPCRPWERRRQNWPREPTSLSGDKGGQHVTPELVVRNAAGLLESVAYHELPAMLLNELQKQQATIQAQQALIEALLARVAKLEAPAQR